MYLTACVFKYKPEPMQVATSTAINSSYDCVQLTQVHKLIDSLCALYQITVKSINSHLSQDAW